MGDDMQKFIVNSLEETKKAVMANLAEMREIKGELREFKEHVLGRVEKLESAEGKRRRELTAMISILIASGALLLNIIDKLFY
jgi:gamma-glutamylcyclotransferase (GGCT)/AIG2-like uncharacterized protein YtfP